MPDPENQKDGVSGFRKRRQGNGALGFLVVAEAVGDRFGSCI
jgi:hypothetical protein